MQGDVTVSFDFGKNNFADVTMRPEPEGLYVISCLCEFDPGVPEFGYDPGDFISYQELFDTIQLGGIVRDMANDGNLT